MIISRTKHAYYLEAELQVQTEEFKKKLNSKAVSLLVQRELFVGLYIKFHLYGEMVMDFPTTRAIPRINEHYYCMLLPNNLRKYREWGENMTYKELVSNAMCSTELRCIWQGKSEDPRFIRIGFNRVSLQFKEALENNNNKVALVLGPKVPPYEYLSNLHGFVSSDISRDNPILDSDYSERDKRTILLDGDTDIVKIADQEFHHNDVFTLQGPPGTGKTHRIASLCKHYCSLGKSVLVTALTNQALMSVAEKLVNSSLMDESHIYKTSLSADEKRRYPLINSIDEVIIVNGALVLASFYKMSDIIRFASNSRLFDYVIVDEASQAYLSTLAAVKSIGNKTLFVGDINQMPPISKLSDNMIKRNGFAPLIDGLKTYVNSFDNSIYQLTVTFRLGPRGASFTGMFYNNTLKPYTTSLFDGTSADGPVIIKLPLPIGEYAPDNAIGEAVKIVRKWISYPKKQIAILSHRIATVQMIQSAIVKEGLNNNNLIVDTVARVQGITKDVVIFIIPNTDSMMYCLERRLFNVATSRARENTYIIIDNNYDSYQFADPLTIRYLKNAE